MEPATPVRQTIDVQPGDRDWVDEFAKQIDMLASMAIEMMETNRSTVLSQVFRQMLAEKAKLVLGMVQKVKPFLCVDNLHEPLSLSPWKPTL